MDITNEFLNKTLEYLNSAEAFLQKNVPVYVEEMLAFDFYESIFFSIFPIVLVLFLAIILYFSNKISDNSEKYSSDIRDTAHGANIITVLVLILTLLYALFVVPENIMTAVKIKVAPRVYLVEKISSMVKK